MGHHEWDPSVLHYAYPSEDGEPTWSTDPNERFDLNPKFDEFGDYTQRAAQTLNILDDSSQHMTPLPTIRANKHVLSNETSDYEKFGTYFGWVNVDTVQKTIEQSIQWEVSIPNTFPMKKHLKSRNPPLNVNRGHEAAATDTVFSDTPQYTVGLNRPKSL